MSVIDVNVIRSSGSQSQDGMRTYNVLYHVITDDRYDGPGTVLSSTASIPSVGAAYAFGNEVDTGVTCKTRTAALLSAEDARKIWTVNVNYESVSGRSKDPTEDRGSDPIDDPLAAPAEWSGGWTQETIAAIDGYTVTADVVDHLGVKHAIKNSAGQRFNPMPTTTISRERFTVKKNFSEYSEDWDDHVGSVNGAAIWRWPLGALKCADISWNQLYTGKGERYVSASFTFEGPPSDRNLNTVKVLDAGFQELDTSTTPDTLKYILDKNNQSPSEPYPLDDGSAMSQADIASGLEEYLEWVPNDLTDFGELGLPVDFGGKF